MAGGDSKGGEGVALKTHHCDICSGYWFLTFRKGIRSPVGGLSLAQCSLTISNVVSRRLLVTLFSFWVIVRTKLVLMLKPQLISVSLIRPPSPNSTHWEASTTHSHSVVQAGLELTMYFRLGSHSKQSSCFNLLRVEVMSVPHHTWPGVSGSNEDPACLWEATVLYSHSLSLAACCETVSTGRAL